MELMVRKSLDPGDPLANREGVVGDPESLLGKAEAKISGPLFVYKNAVRSVENIDTNRRASQKSKEKFSSIDYGNTQTASYKHLARAAQRVENNKRESRASQSLTDAGATPVYKTQNIGDVDVVEQMTRSVLDTQFGENKALTRHIGRIGTKNMRAYQDSDHQSLDHGNEKMTMMTKNPSRRTPFF